jgi:hypothetical protein
MRQVILVGLLLCLPSMAAAHLLNMTEVQATVERDGELIIHIKLDLLRASGTPEAYFELASRGDAALEHGDYEEMWQNLQQGIEIHQSGEVFQPTLIGITAPTEPLSAFQSAAAWPMTEFTLRSYINPSLSASIKLRSLFPFEEPIAISWRNSFDDRQKTRWVISNQSSPNFISQLASGTDFIQTRTADQWAYLLSTLWQGIIHVLPLGYDHLLFLLCLYLAAHTWRERITTITLFTVAHCITLGLAAYRVIELPSAWVEVAIAVSILIVALGNLLGRASSFSHWGIVFTFGLLHGFGFATAIRALSMPAESFLLSLLAFNVGVEIGQLTFLVCIWMVLAPLTNKAFYEPKVSLPLSAACAIIATYWMFERITGI